VVGEPLTGSANDQGLQIKIGEGEYKRIPWASFSQDDIKTFAKNPKLEAFVEPFIEVSQQERLAKTAVEIKEPPRLVRPAKQSLVAAMFSSGLGMLLVLLMYAANIYAAYEIAIFRAQPVPLVCGLAAVLPVIGPAIFLSMPTKMKPAEPTWETAPAAPAEAAHATADVNPMQGEAGTQPGGLHLHTEAQPAGPSHPPPTIFQRGQFTFNRRFMETKFAGFFSAVRHGADKDMVLLLKTNRGEFVTGRISRIAANDMHVEAHKGQGVEEIMVPFAEIKEIHLKHKDS
jgi:hypothetical protein